MAQIECIFCKIADGRLPSKKVYEDEKVVAFHDISPQAPIHVLIVPKTHIASCDAIDADNVDYVAAIFEAVPKIAKILGLAQGYRIITNVGRHGCQSVPHLHFHLVGGKQLSEKML